MRRFEHVSYNRLANKKLSLESRIPRMQETLSEVNAEIEKRQSTTMTEEQAKTELGRQPNYIRG